VGGVFIHENHVSNRDLPRLAGWWGHDKKKRFLMEPHFEPMLSAEAWQLSNAPVFSMAVHKVALDMFTEVGMPALRMKAIELTGYLEYILNHVAASTGVALDIITPKRPEERGCQLSVVVPNATSAIVKQLASRGVVVDWREPNVIRMAPVPMYNSFTDVYRFGQIFEEELNRK
jgi:kynureninase